MFSGVKQSRKEKNRQENIIFHLYYPYLKIKINGNYAINT